MKLCIIFVGMKKLYTPSDESELVFLKSFLDAEGVPYYVMNENFGSLYSGVYVSNFNAKTIMVPDDVFEEAKEFIRSVNEDAVFEDERGGDGVTGEQEHRKPGVLDSLLDFLSFRWLQSGSGRRDRDRD